MRNEELKEIIQKPEYQFLYSSPFLGKECNGMLLLGLGGSHAYGTANENSDLDLRGIAFNPPEYLLTGRDFEQVVDTNTDTVVYSFDKMIKLLVSANPNTLEILGQHDDAYAILTDEGKELLKNQKLFLSRRVIYSFGGYAHQQLLRLCNKAARLVSQKEQEAHILKSIEHARMTFHEKYEPLNENSALHLYVDSSRKKDYNSEIFFDGHFEHYPLRDFADMWNEMHSVIKSYEKIGKRNEKAIEHNKLGKHMMHLVRLYYMAFDILENEKIVTYRTKEHDFLMEIRNGKFLDENRQPIPEFYDLVNDLEKRLEYAGKHTALPETPDMKKVYELQMELNKKHL